MAELRTKNDVFHRLWQDSHDSEETRTAYKLDIFVGREMDKYRRKYSFMQNVTTLEFCLWRLKLREGQERQELSVPVPTNDQFWRAVYDYDPFKLTPNTHSDLHRYLTMKNLDSVPLGKYGGYATLELVRRMGALPNTETIRNHTNLKYAATDSGAISYPDAHPSELEDDNFKVKDSQDLRLRRFASLGWVIYVRPDGSWVYTGHVLVVDMGEGRGRQPWFVLASEWPREVEDAKGSFFDHAPAQVDIDDASQPGVLPGGNNRTVVGIVMPMKKNKIHVLQQFGPDFNFLVNRDPPDRAYHSDPTRGPDLAHIMTWYWDPVREVEVCYYKDGREYMTYSRETKYYTYTSLRIHRLSVAGEVGMFGMLANLPESRFIFREERMGQAIQSPIIRRGGFSSSLTTY